MNPEINGANGLNTRFGSVVRELRRARGWSQEALAERADLNRSFLGEIERGHAEPSLATLTKLATALQLPLSTLLSRCEASALAGPHSPAPFDA